MMHERALVHFLMAEIYNTFLPSTSCFPKYAVSLRLFMSGEESIPVYWYIIRQSALYVHAIVAIKISRMSNDSVSCKYPGSRISIDYSTGKYQGCRIYVLFALTYHVPVQRYWALLLYIHQRRGCTMLESRTLLVKTTVFMCFSDPIIDERSLHTIMLIYIATMSTDFIKS